MSELIEKRDAKRSAALSLIYELTNGSPDVALLDDEFARSAQAQLGMSSQESQSVLDYLTRSGYCEAVDLNSFSITAKGIDLVETTREESGARGNKDASPVHHVQNIQFYGSTVGAIQSGSHNTANVAQQVGSSVQDVLGLINELRAEIPKFPEDKREQAEALVDSIEEQAKQPEPKTKRIAAYAEALKQLGPGLVPTLAIIEMIVKYFLTK